MLSTANLYSRAADLVDSIAHSFSTLAGWLRGKAVAA